METVAVNIENLCVPCHCGCRHCLLNSCHRATGVPYLRGEAFARSFFQWLGMNRPDLSGMHYVGYSMDFPELPRYIRYFREQTGMSHLMLDGIAIRSDTEILRFLLNAQNAGTESIHLTFYGTEAYHDRFAGRHGDFGFLLRLAKFAGEIGMQVSTGIMLMNDNAGQMPELLTMLRSKGLENPALILPHAKGRGEGLSHLRLTRKRFECLPGDVKALFPIAKYKTEAQWIADGVFPEAKSRHLTLSLTPDNIERLEHTHPAEVIRELEQIDDAYFQALPDIHELAVLCGKPDNDQLFRFRDLSLQWQKRYWKKHTTAVHDVHDERFSFSTRIYPE